MRIRRQWFVLGLIISVCVLTGCQKPAEVSSQTSNSTAPSTPQKLDDATNKKRIDMQVYQISQSKLPDAEKQRLIEQVRASSPK